VIRERIGSFVLRAYPPLVRRARGPEMLSMLLDAGEPSRLEFTHECGSLVIGGLRERAHSGGLRLLAAAGMIVAALAVGVLALGLTTSGRQEQGNMPRLVAQVMTRLHPGDLVFVTDPGQTPLAHKYLPDDMRYATPLGLDSHPAVAYHHTFSRLLSSYSPSKIERLLTTLTAGEHVLVIRALLGSTDTWRSPETSIARLRAAQLQELLAQDRKLRLVTRAPRKYQEECCVRDAALLYVQS
jgi:hypothetical protein